MKKIALFFCDIQGTITNSWTDIQTEEEYYNMINEVAKNIGKLKEVLGVEEVQFSFITDDSEVEYLKRYLELVKVAMSQENVKLGKQFYARGCLDPVDFSICEAPSGKIKKMHQYVQTMESDQYQIEHIIYADDLLYPNMDYYKLYHEKIDPNIPLTLFVPQAEESLETPYYVSSTKCAIIGLNDACKRFYNKKIVSGDYEESSIVFTKKPL